MPLRCKKGAGAVAFGDSDGIMCEPRGGGPGRTVRGGRREMEQLHLEQPERAGQPEKGRGGRAGLHLVNDSAAGRGASESLPGAQSPSHGAVTVGQACDWH